MLLEHGNYSKLSINKSTTYANQHTACAKSRKEKWHLVFPSVLGGGKEIAKQFLRADQVVKGAVSEFIFPPLQRADVNNEILI